MSFIGSRSQHPEQVCCYVTRATEQTHDIIRSGFDRSPMFAGSIEGVGPRYCPSIEDKVNRFADKDSHQIFVEPEGLTTNELYPNGISTSLPFDIQLKAVRSIPGFENAHILRPGYAIEYDYLNPQDLRHTLETKFIQGLYFAGQIMGTTEPYRMFTSRAEYRLILREDNADLRLTETGRKLGLVNDERWQKFNDKREAIATERSRLEVTRIHPNTEAGERANGFLKQPMTRDQSLAELLSRPEIVYSHIAEIGAEKAEDPVVADQVEIEIKYEGYISRQADEIERLRKNENTALPLDLDYDVIGGLSNEI